MASPALVQGRRGRGNGAVVVDGKKRCSGCGVIKALEAYGTHPAGAGGRRSKCKACCKERLQQWKQENRGKVRAHKRASWDRHKERLNGERRAKRGDHQRKLARQWRLDNPERYRAQTRAYRQNNPARVSEWHKRWYAKHGREWTRAWREKNPEKVRARNHRRRAAVRETSPEIEARIATLLTEPCIYCGSAENIEVEHVVPLSRGGDHVVDNLAPACQRCNRSKHNKLLSEWGGPHR